MTFFTNKNPRSDVHMDVLKFARNNPGFTPKNLKKKFPDHYEWLWQEIQYNGVFRSDTSGHNENSKYFLSFDDRFKLLEHEELRDARRSSKFALYTASISILIAVAALIIQHNSIVKTEVVNFPSKVETKEVIKPTNEWSPF